MERYVSILIGFLAIAGIVVMLVKRPTGPRLRGWPNFMTEFATNPNRPAAPITTLSIEVRQLD